MAFTGRMDADGKVVLNGEVFTGRTRISSISSLSDQSEQQWDSNSPEFLSPQRWEPSNLSYDDQAESSSSLSAPLSLPPPVSNTSTTDMPNTDSLYRWSETYDAIKQVESLSNVVPSLQLDSKTSTLDSKTSTLDYLRELDGLKLDRQPQVAFDNWFASKQVLRQQQQQRLKEEREYNMQKHEHRKQMAKYCYEKWLHDKAQKAAEHRLDKHLQMAALQAESAATRGDNAGKKPVRNVPQAEIRQVVQSWWLKKQEQLQRQNQEKQRHRLKKAREEQRRKQLAETAWEKWMSKVYGKPKPVPMNQGIDSLRGTIAPIYVNPVPWQPLKKPQEEQS